MADTTLRRPVRPVRPGVDDDGRTARPPLRGPGPGAPPPSPQRSGGPPPPRAERRRRMRWALLLAALAVFGLSGGVVWWAYDQGIAGLGGEPPLVRADP